jgi:hypothetical protein
MVNELEPPSAHHALSTFIGQVSDEMASEYERIRNRATEDPGTAGDEGEQNWAALLREWLPAHYHVVTKGRILGITGDASPQLDVVVLSPAYPPKLLERKLYLADGVVAAFECKLTLRKHHIRKSVETAKRLRYLMKWREGTPYQELYSPLIYGLLSHSHSWTRAPRSAVTQNLVAADLECVEHPKEMIDLICVADLGTWHPIKMAGILPAWGATADSMRGRFGMPTEGGVLTSYAEPNDPIERKASPIGTMLGELIRRIAWEDGDVRPVADYFRYAMVGAAQGHSRAWPLDVYREQTRADLESRLVDDVPWSEWSVVFP